MEKITVNTTGEKSEVIIREVNNVNELPIKPPVKIDLCGTIHSVLNFLSKRYDTEQIDQKRCNIIVNREKMSIQLTINEHDYYLGGMVKGTLTEHQKIAEFGINKNKEFAPEELAQFLKMNRFFFENKDENMSLVSKLKSFKAKIENTLEKEKNQNGSFADNYSSIVNSNLPEKFRLKMPLFKGHESVCFDVEIYANVSGRNVSLSLFSPDANLAAEDVKNVIIDDQIERIQTICPDIVIIEQ